MFNAKVGELGRAWGLNLGSLEYCRFGNVRENLIFTNIREFVVSRIQSPHLYWLIKLICLRRMVVRLSLERYFSQLKEVSILRGPKISTQNRSGQPPPPPKLKQKKRSREN